MPHVLVRSRLLPMEALPNSKEGLLDLWARALQATITDGKWFGGVPCTTLYGIAAQLDIVSAFQLSESEWRSPSRHPQVVASCTPNISVVGDGSHLHSADCR